MMTRLDRLLVTKCYNAITALADGESEIVPKEEVINSIRNPFNGDKGVSTLMATLALRSVMEREILNRISDRLIAKPQFAIRYYPHQLHKFFDGLTTFFISANGFIQRDEKNKFEAILTCTTEEFEHLKDEFENTKTLFEDVEYFFYDVFRVYEEDAVEEILRDATELLKRIIAAFGDSKKSKLQYSITFDLSSLLNRVRAIVAEVENEQEIQLYDLIYSPEERLALAYLIRKHGVKNDVNTIHSSNATDETEQAVISKASDTDGFPDEALTLKNIQDDTQTGDVQRIPIRPSTREKVLKWFRLLVEKNILTEEEAAFWICAEFSGFKRLSNTNRLFAPKMDKGCQSYFIKTLQMECAPGEKKMVNRFRAMIKRRLIAFQDNSDIDITRKFTRKPKEFDAIFA